MGDGCRPLQVGPVLRVIRESAGVALGDGAIFECRSIDGISAFVGRENDAKNPYQDAFLDKVY
jgi:hypothetical protein